MEAMRWISGLARIMPSLRSTADGRTQATKRYDAIEIAAKEHGARLVVLDTAADLFAGNENDRHQVRRFIGLLNNLAQAINGAVLLNAHPSRTGLSTGNLDGGSPHGATAFAPDGHSPSPGADGDAKQPDTSERILTRRKANYAKHRRDIALRVRMASCADNP